MIELAPVKIEALDDGILRFFFLKKKMNTGKEKDRERKRSNGFD
jgi:hypothetical protein